jgi:hypothetical protein
MQRRPHSSRVGVQSVPWCGVPARWTLAFDLPCSNVQNSAARPSVLNQPARHDHPHDLVRALEDLVHAQVAHDLGARCAAGSASRRFGGSLRRITRARRSSCIAGVDVRLPPRDASNHGPNPSALRWALSTLAIIVPPPLSLVVSQFEFQLCVGANGSCQASGPPDIRR